MARKLTNDEKIKVITLQGKIKKGDRIGCTKCPGTKRVFTFDHWDGFWMVSKTGINDYSPFSIYSINGMVVI